jgi:hypothetical protein
MEHSPSQEAYSVLVCQNIPSSLSNTKSDLILDKKSTISPDTDSSPDLRSYFLKIFLMLSFYLRLHLLASGFLIKLYTQLSSVRR